LLGQAHAAVSSGNLNDAQKDSVREQIKALSLQRELLQSQIRLSVNSEAESSASSRFFKGKFGNSAIVRKHMGSMPGYISSAKAAAEEISRRSGVPNPVNYRKNRDIDSSFNYKTWGKSFGK